MTSGEEEAAGAPDARREVIAIGTIEEAERLGFRGSPSILIEGHDIEPGAPAGVGLG